MWSNSKGEKEKTMEEKSLSKQFLAQRDRIDALMENLHIDLILYSFFESILGGEEFLPKEISPCGFLMYLNESFSGHFCDLREAWRTAEEIYDRMEEPTKI